MFLMIISWFQWGGERRRTMEETILKSGRRRDSGSCAVTALSRDEANFAQHSREKIANFRKSGTPRAKKTCVHSASVRCACFTTSLRVDRVSIAVRSEKESVPRRDHANFAPNSRERIVKSPKNFGAPRAQKLRELDQRGCANCRTSL